MRNFPLYSVAICSPTIAGWRCNMRYFPHYRADVPVATTAGWRCNMRDFPLFDADASACLFLFRTSPAVAIGGGAANALLPPSLCCLLSGMLERLARLLSADLRGWRRAMRYFPLYREDVSASLSADLRGWCRTCATSPFTVWMPLLAQGRLNVSIFPIYLDSWFCAKFGSIC